MKKIKNLFIMLLLAVLVVSVLPVTVFAADPVTPVENITVSADSATSGPALSNGVVTITRKGNTLNSGTACTITITNSSEVSAKISFVYAYSDNKSSLQGNGSLSLDGTSVTSGTYSNILAAGGKVTMTLKGGSGQVTGTATLSNFSWEEIVANPQITTSYNDTYGSVTVDGTAVSNGAVTTTTKGDTVTLAATTKNSSQFLGWVNASTGALLSTSESYSFTTESHTSVKAVFGHTNLPCFYVGAGTSQSQSYGLFNMSTFTYHTVSGTYLFDDLNAAATAAANGTSKYVVLANDGTLPAGNYTIPSGVTLLIPFDSANTCYKTNAQWGGENITTPTAYRTLTMADGANLVINGAMSISGKHTYANAGGESGSPTGPLGFVKMNTGSNITVNDGGTLYAYGYIIGSGTVTAENGATVYESLQLPEYRGGSQSTEMENSVFPFSQFYIQNIEVPLTLKYGATEYAYCTVYGSSMYVPTGANLIGPSNSMFNVTSGYVTKWYDGTVDRIFIDIYGEIEVSSISLELESGSIDSSEFVLPINGGYTIQVNSGSKLTVSSSQEVLLQPGAKLVISEGATCTVNSALYVYDADQWGDFTYYGVSGGTNSYNTPVILVTYSPTRTYTRPIARKGETVKLEDASIQVDGTLSGKIYTTTGKMEYTERGNGDTEILGGETYGGDTFTDGANIFSKGSGVIEIYSVSQTETYQVLQDTWTYTTGTIVTSTVNADDWIKIPITSAKLKNDDGSYVETASSTSATTYHYAHGVWHETDTAPTEVTDEAVAATCTATGLTEGKHCSVCNEVLVAQTEVDALGHTEVIDEAVAATCTATGLTTGSHCSVCNDVLVAQETVDATGHTAETPVKENVVNATCTAAGSYDTVVYCTVCNAELSRETITVPAGHTDEGKDGKCDSCNAYLVSFTVSHNLNLLDLVQIGYWVEVETNLTPTSYGILIWSADAYSDETNYTVNSTKAKIFELKERMGYWHAYGDGIYAQYLDTVYYAIPYVQLADGTCVYGSVDQFSVPMYATSAMASSSLSNEVKAVVRDLLNYATDVQKYFTYRTAYNNAISNEAATEEAAAKAKTAVNALNPINSVLENTDSNYNKDSMLVSKPDGAAGDGWKSYSTVVLEEAISLKVYTDSTASFDALLHWNEDDHGDGTGLTYDENRKLTYEPRAMSDGETKMATISGICAKDIADWHYVYMYYNSELGACRVDSVAAYLSRTIISKENATAQEDLYLVDACKNLLAYGASAKAYAASIGKS